MDTNVEILIELAELKELSNAFRAGDRIRCSLASTLDAIVETITFQATYYMILHHIEKEKDKSTLMGLATVQ